MVLGPRTSKARAAQRPAPASISRGLPVTPCSSHGPLCIRRAGVLGTALHPQPWPRAQKGRCPMRGTAGSPASQLRLYLSGQRRTFRGHLLRDRGPCSCFLPSAWSLLSPDAHGPARCSLRHSNRTQAPPRACRVRGTPPHTHRGVLESFPDRTREGLSLLNCNKIHKHEVYHLKRF